MSNYIARQAGSAIIWKAIQVGGGKFIFLARTLILARLLVPDDFGLLAISLVTIGFLESLTNLGMVPALIQHLNPDKRQYDTAWTISMGRAILISLVVFLSAPIIAALFTEPRAVDLVRVMALRPVFAAATSIRIAELNRNLHFRALAFIYLPEALVNTIVSIILAPIVGVWSLVIGILAGQSAFVLMSYIMAPHWPKLTFDTKALRPLIRYGQWIFLSGLVAVAGSTMIQLAISRKLGVEELGLYFLAAKLAFIPNEVSGEVIGTVAFPFFARIQKDVSQVARAFRAILISVSTLTFPVCILMVVLAPSMVTNVLGHRWEGTAPLIQLLALVNIIGLFGDTTVPILKGLGHPNKLVVIEVLQSALLIGLIWSLTSSFGVIGAPLAWLGAVGSSQFISAMFIHRLLPEPFAKLRGTMFSIVSVSGVGGLVAWALTNAIPGLLGLVVAASLGLFVIAAALILIDRFFKFGIARDFGRAFPQFATLVGLSAVE